MGDLQSTVDFLFNLSENNSKQWMDEHRDEYEKYRKEFVEFTFDINEMLCDIDDQMRMIKPQKYLFRINRDIRFSKDKTPYKPHFSAAFVDIGKKTDRPGYYMRIDRFGQLWLGGGWYGLDAEQLKAVRDKIVSDYDGFADILKSRGFKKYFKELSDEENKLKRTPKSFEDGQDYSELLKYREFFVMNQVDIDNQSYDELAKIVKQHYRQVHKLLTWLRNI